MMPLRLRHVQVLEVVLAIRDEAGERGRCIAYGGLVRGRVLNDLGAKMGGLDGPEVLLI